MTSTMNRPTQHTDAATGVDYKRAEAAARTDFWTDRTSTFTVQAVAYGADPATCNDWHVVEAGRVVRGSRGTRAQAEAAGLAAVIADHLRRLELDAQHAARYAARQAELAAYRAEVEAELAAPVAAVDHVNATEDNATGTVAEFVQGRRDSGPQAALAWLTDYRDTEEVQPVQRHRGVGRASTSNPLTRAERLNVWALVLMLSAAASLGAGPVALTTPQYGVAAVFGALGLAFGAWSLAVARRARRGKHSR